MRSAWQRLPLLFVLLLCACFCLTRLAEVDFHWHLLAGERILDQGRVPRVDELSHASSGRPWVDLQWLFQVLLAAVWRGAGWTGLDLLKVGLVLSGFGLAMAAARARGAPSLLVSALGLVAVVAAQERFSLRPEAATFFLLGALLFGLERARRRKAWLIGLPVLLAAWANLHALYAVGLGLVWLALIGEGIDRLRPRPGEGGALGRPMLIAAVAASAATLVTPYGLAGWRLPGRLLFERIAPESFYSARIAEFQGPFSGYGFTTAMGAFALLAIVVLTGLWFGRRRVRPADLLLIAACLVLALLARRNVPLFALVALPAGAPSCGEALGRAIDALGRRLPRMAARLSGAGVPLVALLVSAAALGLLADVVGNRFHARDRIHRSFGRGEAPAFYPEGPARFVRESRPPGEAFHDMASGGYLEWRWHPERRGFLDGRLEVHDETLFAGYLAAERDPGRFEALAGRHGIGVVVWSHRQSAQAAPLLRHLAAGPGWRTAFVDAGGAVFVRSGAGGGEGPAVDLSDPGLAARLLAEARAAEAEAAARDPVPAFVRRWLPRRDLPVIETNAGLFFAVAGYPAVAEPLLRAALARDPHDAVLHYDLGLVLEQGGRPAEARAAFAAALRIDPAFAPAHAAEARALVRAGDPEGAIERWRLAERGGSLGAAELQMRAPILARRGRLDEAIEDLRRAVRLDPARADALSADLALLLHRRGLRDAARAEVRRALEAWPGSPWPSVALARLEAADGHLESAEAAARTAVAAAPGEPRARLALAAVLAAGGRTDEALRECAAALASGLDRAALHEEPLLRSLAEHPALRPGADPGPARTDR